MNKRSAPETLTLARDYLDSLLADSTLIPWKATRLSRDAALIRALLSTAPAIRELLQRDIDWYRYWGSQDASFLSLPLAHILLSTPHAAQWITEREAK